MSEITQRIGKAAVYEQLAEECVELAKASLKMARILRKRNPTPITKPEAKRMIIEEFSDVWLCAQELQIHKDDGIISKKLKRWYRRLNRQRGRRKEFDEGEN